MRLDLKPGQQQVVGRAIQAGLIETAADVVEVGADQSVPAVQKAGRKWLRIRLSRIPECSPSSHFRALAVVFGSGLHTLDGGKWAGENGSART